MSVISFRILTSKGWRPHIRLPTSLYSSELCQRLSTSSVLYSWKNFSLEEDLTPEIRLSIEKKWYNKVYGVECPAERNKKMNRPSQMNKPSQKSATYILSMFPYPSGRLHLGHVRVYTLSDVLARYHRLQGKTVVHPMGWDAFGLPAENAARDNGVDAEKWTRENITHMKKQILDMGCCFDWERELATCDPSYFKWTQWLFIQLWGRGLVYKKRAYVYWDPVDETVLAEEQVNSEMCSWRSGAKVEKKLLQQWFIRTAVFAEQLSTGLSSGQLRHGWRDVVKLQDHWIGKIKGYFTDCMIDVREFVKDSNESSEEPVRLWFSSLDSLKKAKYFILRPDHFLLEDSNISTKTFPDGLRLLKIRITNPLTGVALPVFSGPTDIIPSIPSSSDCRTDECLPEEEYEDLSVNESFLVTMSKLMESLQDSFSQPGSSTQQAEFKYYPASLKLRDWLVSRQRKWGTPIPAIDCRDCGKSSVMTTEELPVTNANSSYTPTKCCSHCGSTNLRPETDTLDTFFDSSWYFYRYLDPKNQDKIFDFEKVSILPVHTYIGGKEHATLHLYYARFMSQFLYSIGLSPVTEPFEKLIPIGMVLGEAYIVKGSGQYLSKDDCEKGEKVLSHKVTGDAVYTKWEKMSKSKHNGINPESILHQYGIDTTRLLTMCETAPTSPRKWPPNNTDAFLNWQSKLWIQLRQFVDAKDFGDIVFIDDEVWQKSEIDIFEARNFYLKGINNDYSSTSQISVAISKLQGLFSYLKKVPKTFLKESIEYERAFGAAIICLYPVMPAFSAQLWQSFRAVATCTEPEFDLDNEVWEQQWPTVDWKYQLDLICKIKGQEVIVKVERNYLDTMEEDTALQIALEQPEVQKLISTGKCEVSRFVIEPGFRATISIRVAPTPPDSAAQSVSAPKFN